MAYRVAVYNAISASGLGRFAAPHYAVGKALADADAILLRSHALQLSEIPATVKAIARAGAGVNNIPVDEMSKRGVPVFNAPGANANAVKELVIAAVLLAARNVVPAIGYVQSLAASPDFEKRVEDGKKQFAGVELPGRTLGIIGLGAIGGLVAETAIRLGMKVTGYDPEITVDNAWRLPGSVKRAASIEDVLKSSDFVTIHVPLNNHTRHMIGRERLAVAKKGMALLNFSRDAVVDEEAVLASIADKRLRAYICDFPSPKLQGHAGVVTLPHLGASTEEAEENCAVMVVDQLKAFLEEGSVANAVNFPSVEMARESPHRIAIANANVPNMVGQISTTMAQAGLNIHNMVNKSKGEMAYTLVDLDSEAAPDLLARIAHIPGVLSIRAIPPISGSAK
ncbi:D-3-phosphoglycerate dehydrogenase [Usitatibacter rugosus]|uniref:D-3-phosphoglycerate dehydrogenase n=1 Tax=Usitatibacter rugosus TaxID=2732067 RepID=A0A6M4GYS2_9PROT|nr:phosphoglycerate dehydrogenase [Usitatibacter rugosus]QJR11563.1 D-3-phosphoglycerate dehydrogenase [Usitatibacter rugosus]